MIILLGRWENPGAHCAWSWVRKLMWGEPMTASWMVATEATFSVITEYMPEGYSMFVHALCALRLFTKRRVTRERKREVTARGVIVVHEKEGHSGKGGGEVTARGVTDAYVCSQ